MLYKQPPPPVRRSGAARRSRRCPQHRLRAASKCRVCLRLRPRPRPRARSGLLPRRRIYAPCRRGRVRPPCKGNLPTTRGRRTAGCRGRRMNRVCRFGCQTEASVTDQDEQSPPEKWGMLTGHNSTGRTKPHTNTNCAARPVRKSARFQTQTVEDEKEKEDGEGEGEESEGEGEGEEGSASADVPGLGDVCRRVYRAHVILHTVRIEVLKTRRGCRNTTRSIATCGTAPRSKRCCKGRRKPGSVEVRVMFAGGVWNSPRPPGAHPHMITKQRRTAGVVLAIATAHRFGANAMMPARNATTRASIAAGAGTRRCSSWM
jgi:hypothetical protein